tara:strand:+ start:589 stop:858 length:270 start_codon:yes stop_codon:yes gene_type:complete
MANSDLYYNNSDEYYFNLYRNSENFHISALDNILWEFKTFKKEIINVLNIELKKHKLLKSDYEELIKESKRKFFQAMEKWVKENSTFRK